MGRMYTVTLDASAETTAVDLLEINAASTSVVILHEVHVTQDDSETSNQLPFQIHRASTSGTGGAAITAQPLQVGHAAYGGTCEGGNTSRGTEGSIIVRQSENILNGFHYVPPPEARPVIPPSGRIVVGLEAAPAASTTFSAWALIEEID